MNDNVKLTQELTEHLLEDLEKREARLNDNLKEHNSRSGMQKKETYIVQGFEIKGITEKHAIKRLKTLLVRSGFHPTVTAEHFPLWYKELKKNDNGNITKN